MIVLIVIFLTTVMMARRNEVGFRNPVVVRENPTVTYTIGEAEYLRKNASKWKEVEIGAVLKEGGAVRTGPDGIIDIRFTDGTAVRITEDSFLSLDDVSLTTVAVGLKKGRLVSKFTKLFSNQNFSVKTPSIVAGVRGTELIVTASEEKSSIVGMSGITEVFNPKYPDDRVLLGFQTKTLVPSDQPPLNPENLTPGEVSTYRNMLDSIHYNKVMVIGKAIQFKPDTAEIVDSSRAELEKLAKKMRWRRFKIEIRGHTADVGDSASQYSLSLERAKTIRNYLISLKIKGKRLTVRGYGGSKPIAPNTTPEGRARNRRVEFVIIK